MTQTRQAIFVSPTVRAAIKKVADKEKRTVPAQLEYDYITTPYKVG
jgi:hypothetical protein